MLIGVVAHVNRKPLAVDVDVISLDNGLPSVAGCAENHIRTLTKLTGNDHDYVVVLEDDARPVSDFREQCALALAKAETPLVGFYLGTGNAQGPTQRAIAPAVLAAEASQAHWIVSDWFISTVGYAVRSSWLPAMIAALKDMGGPIDNRINEWTHSVGVKTWYSVPSLVDHDDETSLLRVPRFQKTPRRAWRVGGRSEWNSRTVEMGYAEGWSPSDVA